MCWPSCQLHHDRVLLLGSVGDCQFGEHFHSWGFTLFLHQDQWDARISGAAWHSYHEWSLGSNDVLWTECVICSRWERDRECLLAHIWKRQERSRDRSWVGSRADLSCVRHCHCRERLNQRVNVNVGCRSGHRTLGCDMRSVRHSWGEAGTETADTKTLSSVHGWVRSEAGQFSNGNIRLMTDHRRGREGMVKKRRPKLC